MGEELGGWLLGRGYASTSTRIYCQYVRRAAGWCADHGITLTDANLDDLEQWWASLPASAASRNLGRKALMAWERSLGRDHPLAVDLPRRPVRQGLPRPLTDEEHDAFLAAAAQLGGEHHALGWTIGLTGARFSEVRLARWAELDLNGGTWLVRGKGAGRSGPHERLIPLHSRLVPILRSWRSTSDSTMWLWPSSQRADRPRCEHALRYRIATICARAGLAGVTPHRLRHTVATRVLEQTGDLRIVQELLGHTNLSTTAVYTQVAPRRLRAAVDTLPCPPGT